LIDEWNRCANDPIYFLKTYVKVIHLDRGIVPFEMYPYQEEIANAISGGERRILFAAARQCGKTQSAAGMILHYICFNEAKNVGIVAQQADQAQEIVRRIQDMFQSLPDFLKPGVKVWNKRSFSLDNECMVISGASTGSAMRGKSINLLCVDEAAFIKNWDDFAAGTLPVVSSGQDSIIVFMSTPNGMNHFYNYVDGAKKNINGWKLIEAPWWKVPGRDEVWKQKTLAEMNFDEQRFAVEYSVEFLGSSGTLISGSTLKALASAIQNPMFSSNEGFKQFERPERNHQYAMICDVSEGKGLDYQAFHVIDITELPYRQVGSFRNNQMTPSDYAVIINTVGNAYNKAFVLVENNNMGG
jgi:hypothetical protein